MINLLSLEMLDDGTVILELQSGTQSLRTSVPNVAAVLAAPLFVAFQGFKSGDASLPIMQNLAAQMNTAVATAAVVAPIVAAPAASTVDPAAAPAPAPAPTQGP